MFRVFAPEGESVRKYALIFRGISENRDGKNKKRLRFESCLYCFHLVSIKHRLFGRGAAYSDDINPRRFSTADVFIVYMLLRCPIKQRNRLHRVCVQAVSPFLFLPRVGSIQSPSTLFGQSMSCLSFDRPHVHSVPRSFILRPVCHHLSAHTACAIPPLAQTCGQPNTPVER